MSPLLALSLSIAVLGGIWAYLALSPLAGFVLVWAGFIAWGSFFHSGGDTKALVKSLCGNVYGIVIGWIALLIIFKTGVADMGRERSPASSASRCFCSSSSARSNRCLRCRPTSTAMPR